MDKSKEAVSLNQPRYLTTKGKLSMNEYVEHINDPETRSIIQEIKQKTNPSLTFKLIAHLLDREASIRNDEILENGMSQDEIKQKTIDEHQENGKIMLVIDSQDCDGVRVSGVTQMVTANVQEVDEAMESIYSDAEGPTYVDIDRPSNKEKYEHCERDTYAERMNY